MDPHDAYSPGSPVGESPRPRAAAPTDFQICWELVEEHLDEAGFVHRLWERALDDPRYTLQDLADGPEERLLANVDGLVIHGRRAAEELLLPALAGDDPDLVFPAAYALLASEDGDFTEPVLRALQEGAPDVIRELVRALQLAPRPDVPQRLLPIAADGPLERRVAALEVLAFRRVDPAVRLDPLLASEEPEARRAALCAARVFPARVDPGQIEYALRSGDPEERSLAIETGMILGLPSAWAACRAVVASGDAEGWDRPALLYALSGEKELAPLQAGLADPHRRNAALFALGATGRIEAVDAVTAFLGDEGAGRLAGEALSSVSGIPIANALAKARAPWTPDTPEREEDEEYTAESELPEPEPKAVAQRWIEARTRLDPALRHLDGKPWTAESAWSALIAGTTRRRHVLALELALRTRGRCQLELRAFARSQIKEQAALTGGRK